MEEMGTGHIYLGFLGISYDRKLMAHMLEMNPFISYQVKWNISFLSVIDDCKMNPTLSSSNNKPYCDGAHANTGFKAEAKDLNVHA